MDKILPYLPKGVTQPTPQQMIDAIDAMTADRRKYRLKIEDEFGYNGTTTENIVQFYNDLKEIVESKWNPKVVISKLNNPDVIKILQEDILKVLIGNLDLSEKALAKYFGSYLEENEANYWKLLNYYLSFKESDRNASIFNKVMRRYFYDLHSEPLYYEDYKKYFNSNSSNFAKYLEDTNREFLFTKPDQEIYVKELVSIIEGLENKKPEYYYAANLYLSNGRPNLLTGICAIFLKRKNRKEILRKIAQKWDVDNLRELSEDLKKFKKEDRLNPIFLALTKYLPDNLSRKALKERKLSPYVLVNSFTIFVDEISNGEQKDGYEFFKDILVKNDMENRIPLLKAAYKLGKEK